MDEVGGSSSSRGTMDGTGWKGIDDAVMAAGLVPGAAARSGSELRRSRMRVCIVEWRSKQWEVAG